MSLHITKQNYIEFWYSDTASPSVFAALLKKLLWLPMSAC